MQIKLKRSRGFSFVELLGILGVIGVIAASGYTIYSNVYSSAQTNKLQSEVKMLNSAVGAYLGFGGNLDSLEAPEDVIAQLRSVAQSDVANRIPGLSSSMVDRRISAVKQTDEQAATSQPRVLWNQEKKMFEVASKGAAGLTSFFLSDVELTPAEDSREFAYLYSSQSTWVWDHGADSNAAAQEGPSAIVTYDPLTIPNTDYPSSDSTPDTNDPDIIALAAPVFSLGGGSFSIREYPLALNVINPNPVGSSDIFYQVDHGPWLRMEADTAMEVTPGSSYLAQAIARSDRFADSSSSSETYDATPVQLNAPAISTSAEGFGVFNNRIVLASFENTNGDDPAKMQYSLNDGPWLEYNQIFIMDKLDFSDGVMIKSRAIADEESTEYGEFYLASDINSKWVSPDSINVDDSDGAFHDPDGPNNMETNLAEGEYSNYFEWGAVQNKHGEIDPEMSKSWMDFAGAELEDIIIGERFKLGDIDYHDGVFKSGTHANKVMFLVGLALESEGTIYNTEFDYLFNIAHTTNGQSSFGNARLVMPNGASSYYVDGITFDLYLEFGEADAEYDVQPEDTVSTGLYATLFEREEDASPRNNRSYFTGVFKEFWDRMTNWDLE